MRLKYGFAFHADYRIPISAFIEMHVSSFILGIDTVIMPRRQPTRILVNTANRGSYPTPRLDDMSSVYF